MSTKKNREYWAKAKKTEEIVASWPKWKRDIHICGTKISVGGEIICRCTHPERYDKIREQERIDAKRYSYWPGD